MTIHFCASLPCPLRLRIGDGRLMELHIARRRGAQGLALQGPDSENASRWQHASLLDDLSRQCRRCPFYLGLRDFGCGGSIEAPVSGTAQRWMLQRLPDDLASPAGRMLQQALHGLPEAAAEVESLRRPPRCVLRAQPRRRWGRLPGSRPVVTAGQLLQAAFCSGSLPPRRAGLLAGALGYLDEARQPLVDAGMASGPQDDASVRALKHFFSMAAAAGQRNAGLFIAA